MVDVDELYRVTKAGEKGESQPFLEAEVPRAGEKDGNVLPAELLTLDPARLSLEVTG
jgi:hypothetical protein